MKEHNAAKASQADRLVEANLRVAVLLVVSSPLDVTLAPIDFQREISQLDRTGLPMSITRLNPPTWRNLQDALLPGKYLILHFIGHGNDEGIYLEKRNGQADFISSSALVQVIQESNLSLVIMNTCDSWGPGHALANAGVRAIVASKAPLLDSVVPDITASLYTSLIAGRQTLADAVATAQKTASLTLGTPGQDLLVSLGRGKDVPLQFPDEVLEKHLDTIVSFGEPPHNLPQSPIDSFVGRISELAKQIFPLLDDSRHRAIALVGLAGIGKTWLATAAAWRYSWLFPDGIVFIKAGDNPSFGLDDVLQGLGQVLKWELFTGGATDREGLALEKLSKSQVLLILDNLETVSPDHLSKVVDFLARWDTRLGGKSLMTMRERLPVIEPVVSDAFLPIGSLDSASAIALLKQLSPDVESRNFVDEQHELVQIVDDAYCHPLLIRLTAGLINQGGDWAEFQEAIRELKGPYAKIHEALGQMTRSLIAKHPTIPYLLNGWSVFRDGASSKAWDALVRPYLSLLPIASSNIHDGMGLIREANLVNRDKNKRYFVHPMVGQYLTMQFWDNLPPSEKRQISENYLRYFLTYLDESLAEKGPITLLQKEHLNLRHAFDMARELEEWDVVKSMATKMYKFLDVRGYWAEWEDLIDKGLYAADRTDDQKAKALFFYYRAELCKRRGLHDAALHWLAEAETLAKGVDDQHLLGRITLQTGMVLLPMGRPSEARKKLIESIPVLIAMNDFTRLAKVYRSLADTAHELGRWDEMREYATKSLGLETRELGGIQDYGIAASEKLLGELATEEGDYEGAQRMFERVLPILRDSMDASRQLYAELLHAMGRLEKKKGNKDKACGLLHEALGIARGLGLLHRVQLVEEDLKQLEC